MAGWAMLDSGALSAGAADALATDPTMLSPVIVVGRGAAASDVAALQAIGGSGATSAAPSASAAASAEPSVAASGEASPAASGDAAEVFGITPEQAADLLAALEFREHGRLAPRADVDAVEHDGFVHAHALPAFATDAHRREFGRCAEEGLGGVVHDEATGER